jgi:[ribosomal protein S5]-alanine N-acetyltransferase
LAVEFHTDRPFVTMEPKDLTQTQVTLQGRLCRLEPFTEHHLANPEYLAWLRDAEVVQTLNLPSYLEKPVSFEEVEHYCDALLESQNDLFFAIHPPDDGGFIGTAKAGHINWFSGTADIGIMIGRKDAWGQGMASDALAILCTYLFADTGLRRLTAGVMATNPAMIRVFEKLGFQREGIFRQQDRLGDEYIDHIHLGCLKDEFTERSQS